MKEEWKPITGYKGYYVSNQGKIKKDALGGGQVFVKQYVQRADNRKDVVKIAINTGRYIQQLCVHRLVAEHFLNGSGKFVFHKDGDVYNNSVSNLYFSDKLEHMDNSSKKRAVAQYSIADVFVASYPSITEASKASGAPVGGICFCCEGKTKTSGGYKWKYVEPKNK